MNFINKSLIDMLHGEYSVLYNFMRFPLNKKIDIVCSGTKKRVELLTNIKEFFGFSTKDLCSILRIEKTQLSRWLDIKNDIKLHEATNSRLLAISKIAKEWKKRTRKQLALVRNNRLNNGLTIFELITSNVIDENAIIDAFDELIVKKK